MNVNFNSLSSNALSFFKENVLSSLTDQQKKILIVASIAFSCLAACYLVRQWCLISKVEPLDDVKIDDVKIAPNYLPKSLTDKDIESLRKCSKHWKFSKDENRESILNYIDKVLKDPEFQNDPHVYIKNLHGGEDRIVVCEYIVPEHPAREFFDSMVEVGVIKKTENSSQIK